MENKVKYILLGSFLSMMIRNAEAQYTTGVGVRIGGTSGVALKHFYRPGMASEGILGTFGNGFSLTALIEKYAPVYEAPGLYVYYGGGAHLAIYDGSGSYRNNFGREVDYHKKNELGFGVNGVIGAEYRLPDHIPIAFSLELKPFLEVSSGGNTSFAADPAIGVKFIIR